MPPPFSLPNLLTPFSQENLLYFKFAESLQTFLRYKPKSKHFYLFGVCLFFIEKGWGGDSQVSLFNNQEQIVLWQFIEGGCTLRQEPRKCDLWRGENRVHSPSQGETLPSEKQWLSLAPHGTAPSSSAREHQVCWPVDSATTGLVRGQLDGGRPETLVSQCTWVTCKTKS